LKLRRMKGYLQSKTDDEGTFDYVLNELLDRATRAKKR